MPPRIPWSSMVSTARKVVRGPSTSAPPLRELTREFGDFGGLRRLLDEDMSGPGSPEEVNALVKAIRRLLKDEHNLRFQGGMRVPTTDVGEQLWRDSDEVVDALPLSRGPRSPEEIRGARAEAYLGRAERADIGRGTPEWPYRRGQDFTRRKSPTRVVQDLDEGSWGPAEAEDDESLALELAEKALSRGDYRTATLLRRLLDVKAQAERRRILG